MRKYETKMGTLALSYGFYINVINPDLSSKRFPRTTPNLVSIRKADRGLNKRVIIPLSVDTTACPLTLTLMLTKTRLKVLTAEEAASVAQIRPKASVRIGEMMQSILSHPAVSAAN